MAGKVEEDVVRSDFEKYSALASLAETEGGKKLLSDLAQDVISELDRLSNSYRTITETELRAIGASLHVKLNLYRALKNAAPNAAGAQAELDELLKA